MAQRWITWRSIALGSAAVCLVCALTPYNDYVVANTWLIGSYLPAILTLTFLVLVVGVNAPLRWVNKRGRKGETSLAPTEAGAWAPAPLSSGELAVIMTMLLVACSIPGQGLMRQLLPTLVAPFYFGSSDATFWRAFVKMQLPAWLYPVANLAQGRGSRIVTEFYARVQRGEAIPYGAWIVPLAVWGVFVFAMWTSLIAMSVLVFRQWAHSERLPFPIAQLQAALIEEPVKGKLLNELLGNRLFWGALLAAFLLRSTAVLHEYLPQYIPEIPLGYDLSKLFTKEPWMYCSLFIKKNTIFFTFIGICYFVQARISFSLWAAILLKEIVIVQSRMIQYDMPANAWGDQHLGSCAAFFLGVMWIGRRHWGEVIRGASHRGPALAFLAGIAVMFAWLMVMGVQAWVALAIIAFILLGHFVIARFVAETGFPFIRVYPTFNQIYNNLSPSLFTGRDIYFANVFHINGGAVSTRESPTAFALHGLRVTDTTNPPAQQQRRLLWVIAWSMLLGYVVAAGASLHDYYTYATPITPRLSEPVNKWAVDDLQQTAIVDPLRRFEEGKFPPVRSAWLHMGIGAGVTFLLQYLSLRFAAWPLVPAGYLASTTAYTSIALDSIFIGWLAKVLILRFGGVRLFQRARPFFVGIIFGEALAAGVWLVITLVMAWVGYDYRQILMLPN